MKTCANRSCEIQHNNRSKYCSNECNSREVNSLRIDRLNQKFTEDMTEGYDYLVCPDCGQRVIEITSAHAKMHGYSTIDEFKIKHNWSHVQAKKKIERHIENNPWKDHQGKCSPFSKNNPNYSSEWHEQFARDHSVRQTGSKTNTFCREHYSTEEEYREAQSTFSLDKCIEKHGLEEGARIWQERQDKWQDTLTSKSQEEIDEINKSKFSGGGFSKISQELFDSIGVKESRYGTNGGEYRVKLNSGKHTSFDYFSNGKVIEFNGDLWHANPVKYKEDDKPLETKFFGNMIAAKEIWDKDAKRLREIKELGYEVLVVWELEYKNNKSETVQKCINFLNQ